ncbi:hypothetical protein S7711_11411 [Stachybotrys chartarum IBT 7711]|uniref:Uncharacterized protein n=1 Tax=Stachybotrys chartarum (strain CBS 109288 / IBT 7711) TaxID=1280523 RepID=A0A084B868_STACB|nr:hypothetical protein S7711_11411 [Stachybotrys chartarum IBT 7711]
MSENPQPVRVEPITQRRPNVAANFENRLTAQPRHRRDPAANPHGNETRIFNAVLTDSPKATEERRQLYIVQAALEEQKKLKEEAEEQLAQAHDEIRRFGKDFQQEATENEELKAIIAAQNQTISDYQKENAEHEAENIAAKTLITQLEKLQDLYGENHALAMKDLQEENNNLGRALQEAVTIKDIRTQAEESLKMDIGKLQQNITIEKVEHF